MTNLTAAQVQDLKSEGKFERAGQIAALLGHDDNYGCHFGMRSTRDFAASAFKAGHAEVTFYLTHGDKRGTA